MTPAPTPEAVELAGKLTALAERCEQATGLDRLLDAEINAVILSDYDHISHAYALQPPSVTGGVMVYYQDGTRGRRLAPRYGTSLDAATTLVPASMEWDREAKDKWGRKNATTVWGWVPQWIEAKSHEAATPALALCAAALRALLLKDQSHG